MHIGKFGPEGARAAWNAMYANGEDFYRVPDPPFSVDQVLETIEKIDFFESQRWVALRDALRQGQIDMDPNQALFVDGDPDNGPRPSGGFTSTSRDTLTAMSGGWNKLDALLELHNQLALSEAQLDSLSWMHYVHRKKYGRRGPGTSVTPTT